jgi:hypothetical protein
MIKPVDMVEPKQSEWAFKAEKKTKFSSLLTSEEAKTSQLKQYEKTLKR